ncbi:YkgJ family cysteine cluster protein, partial [Pseudomonas syringae]|nr:YkgJ family cysteine cluster protein [Pseudomonas syringae]
PDTCRNHPKVGPRPGYCAYKPKEVVRQESGSLRNATSAPVPKF